MAASDTYIKLHDGMPDHPKVDPLSDAAFRLLVSSWCWCSRHLTDGLMPLRTWEKRGTRKTREELLVAGFAQVDGETVHWHDYLEHQQSAEQRMAAKEQRREAGRAGGLARSKRVAKRTASESLSEMPSEIEAELEVEVELQTSSVVRRKRATATPDLFPITDAMKAWGAANCPNVLDPQRETRQFLDHHRAKGSTFKDWTAAWRTWMTNAQKFAVRDGVKTATADPAKEHLRSW